MASKKVRCSAPGKVILFGEHAVVYGVLAIAAALSDLRIFVDMFVIEEEEEDGGGGGVHGKRLDVVMHDIPSESGDGGPARITVSYEQLRRVAPPKAQAHVLVPENPSDECLGPLRDEFASLPLPAAQGLMAVAFLMSRLFPEEDTTPSFRIEVKSVGLPIGAGLGSSAAFSVALAGAMLRMRKMLYPQEMDFPMLDETAGEGQEGWTPPEALLAAINGWAYASEVVIHGSPSGLDNTTSCYGGALRYDKNQGTFDRIEALPNMNILLTNTKVPRSTKKLVAAVRELYDAMPSVVKPIFDSIEGISRRFLQLVSVNNASASSEEAGDERARALVLHKEIYTLFRINHDLLCALGVGHASLTAVSEASRSEGLACKLTGAGGGGCAITLLNEDATATSNLKEKLCGELGFETFQSALAGKGCLWYM